MITDCAKIVLAFDQCDRLRSRFVISDHWDRVYVGLHDIRWLRLSLISDHWDLVYVGLRDIRWLRSSLDRLQRCPMIVNVWLCRLPDALRSIVLVADDCERLRSRLVISDHWDLDKFHNFRRLSSLPRSSWVVSDDCGDHGWLPIALRSIVLAFDQCDRLRSRFVISDHWDRVYVGPRDIRWLRSSLDRLHWA